MYALLE